MMTAKFGWPFGTRDCPTTVASRAHNANCGDQATVAMVSTVEQQSPATSSGRGKDRVGQGPNHSSAGHLVGPVPGMRRSPYVIRRTISQITRHRHFLCSTPLCD